MINASPYELHKQREREAVVRDRVREVALPVVYVNLVGGQDELVFDGDSFVMDARGELVQRAPPFEDGVSLVEFRRAWTDSVVPQLGPKSRRCRRDEESVYGALVLGVRDYVSKHRFPGVVHGPLGRRRFRAHARDRRRCARRRPRAGGDDAVALHLA